MEGEKYATNADDTKHSVLSSTVKIMRKFGQTIKDLVECPLSNLAARVCTFVMDMSCSTRKSSLSNRSLSCLRSPFLRRMFLTYIAKSFAVVELKLHLYFLEESFIKAWRLRQAHNYIKAHRKQIPLLRNCGVPQWAQKVSRLIIFLLEYFFPTTVVVIQFIRGSCLSIGANIELSANGICRGGTGVLFRFVVL